MSTKSKTPLTDVMFCNSPTNEEAFEFTRALELLLRDTMEFVQHDKSCPVARGCEEPCDCGLSELEKKWREMNDQAQRRGHAADEQRKTPTT